MSDLSRNIAFIIGINKYSNGISHLNTAVNDATKLTEILQEKHNYEIWAYLDEKATLKHLNQLLIETLPQIVKPKDRVLFYFAGHGVALNGEDGPCGYLIPQDAKLGDVTTYLQMTQLHQSLINLPCRHFLGIFDCCFAGAFRWSSTRDLLSYVPEVIHRERYDRFIKDPAWQIIASAASDQKALDAFTINTERGQIGNHSPFAQALFEALEGLYPSDIHSDPFASGVITASKLYGYLRDRVEEATDKFGIRQTPGLWPLNKHDKGEYIFLTPGHKLNLPPAPELDESKNPYQGLESFNEQSSHLFFGRTALIKQLHEFVLANPLTVVLGASGSGKSSLVKAGLIPQLKQNHQEWCILAPIRPGEAPFTALNNTLIKEKLPAFDKLNEAFEKELQTLARSIEQWSNLYPQAKLLLVIDQFEELITLCTNSSERQKFLYGLASAISAFPKTIRIVLTLRSDFEPQFRETPLEPNWTRARFVVTPMKREELRAAIVEPATSRVMYFEPPHLVEQIIDEVAQMPGMLPLVSFTLSELYLKCARSAKAGERNNRAITQEDYESLGGATRSLTQRADAEYDELVKLDPAIAPTIKFVMLRMVAHSGSELARRRVLYHELEYPEPENTKIQTVIQRFAAARLLVNGQDTEGNIYIEPAHDALVRGWQKLRVWKDEELGNLLLQRELTPSANKWITSKQDKKAVGLLWDNDPRLPLAIQVFQSKENWFNSRESEFVKCSIQRRHHNHLRLVSSVTGVIVALTGLSIFSFMRSVEAQNQTIDALSASSKALLNSHQELDALVESTKAGKMLTHSLWVKPDTKARVLIALHQATYRIRERNRLEGHTDWVASVSFNPKFKI